MDLNQSAFSLSPSDQRAILREIWPNQLSTDFDQPPYERFIQYIHRVFDRFRQNHRVFSPVPTILYLIQFLRSNGHLKKSEIRPDLGRAMLAPCLSDSDLGELLDAAASVWLPVDLNIHPFWRRPMLWESNQTLAEAMAARFPPSPIREPKETHSQVLQRFTIPYLCRNYGFKVVWTDDLSEHLQVDRRDREIAVYPHLICLYNYCSPDEICPIPCSIFEEAIDTINLLLPREDSNTMDFLKEVHGISSFFPMTDDARDRNLDLTHYKVWHHRILELFDIVDEIDRTWEKKVNHFNQWFTWVVGIFALVSTALSIVSIVVAYQANRISTRSLDVAIAQLELSVAELCNDTDIARKLPKHCGLLESDATGYFRSTLKDEADREL